MDEIEEFIGYVKEELMEEYSLSEDKSSLLIKKSDLRYLLEKHGTLAMHYSPETWAEIIFRRAHKERFFGK